MYFDFTALNMWLIIQHNGWLEHSEGQQNLKQ